jgi:hypothetical protein
VTIPREERLRVQRRAGHACEYCHLPESASILPHQIDHIIGKQHRGADDSGNLCLCCIRCNAKKGPNIASVDPESGAVVPLFHPRHHVWRDHFAIEPSGMLRRLTPEGRATADPLEMNHADRVALRLALLRHGVLR